MAVVMAMMCRPPEGALLHGGATDHSEDELNDSPSLEGAMREVAVVPTGKREHSQRIQENTHAEREPAEAHEKYTDACQVDREVGNGDGPVDFF